MVRANRLYVASKSVGHPLKQCDYVHPNRLFARLLSSGLPRCDKISRASQYSASLRGVRRRKRGSAEDILECVEHCLFANPRIISTLNYDALDRFPHQAEWLPHTDIDAQMRSRKGRVTQNKSYGGEWLPRCGILNEKRRG